MAKIFSGQNRVQTTAEALAVSTNVHAVWVQNDPDSGDSMRVGNRDRQDIVLSPGDHVSMHVDNLDEVYVVAESRGVLVNYLATRTVVRA